MERLTPKQLVRDYRKSKYTNLSDALNSEFGRDEFGHHHVKDSRSYSMIQFDSGVLAGTLMKIYPRVNSNDIFRKK